MSREPFFPDIVTSLPEADIPIPGLRAYLLQCEHQQVLFMSFDLDALIAEHHHEAQWGVILDGEIILTIAGKDRTLRKGDSYFIPAGVVHSARIVKGYKDLTVFDQKDRYRAKTSPR